MYKENGKLEMMKSFKNLYKVLESIFNNFHKQSFKALHNSWMFESHKENKNVLKIEV